MEATVVVADPDGRKEVIEELKIVQDILFKQEGYAIATLNQGFVIVAGLVIAYLNPTLHWGRQPFLLLSEAIFLGLFCVQWVYREAFHKALTRSHYLQRILGGRSKHGAPPPHGNNSPAADVPYVPFLIYESVHAPFPTWATLRSDLMNPRFALPNAILFITPIVVVSLR